MLLKNTLLHTAPLTENEWYTFVHGDKGLGHSLELSPVSVPSALEQGRGINCYPGAVQNLRIDTFGFGKKAEGAKNPHW